MQNTFAYLDDILIVTKSSLEIHKNTWQKVLQKLDEENIAITIDKETFACKQIEWLGYSRDSEGTTPLKKTEATEKLAPPKTFKQLKSFMGSIHHLIRYIPHLAQIATDYVRC